MAVRRTGLGILSVTVLLSSAVPAFGQYAPTDPIPMGNAVTSVMANKISGDIADGNSSAASISPRCFADSGPGPERRAMETEYKNRLRTNGRAAADAWRAEHGHSYRAKLVADGKGPAGVLP